MICLVILRSFINLIYVSAMSSHFNIPKAYGHAFYRYLLYGDISTKAAHMLALPKVSDFFTRLIQRVAPKSYQQAAGEVFVTRKFLENFCGDQVRETLYTFLFMLSLSRTIYIHLCCCIPEVSALEYLFNESASLCCFYQVRFLARSFAVPGNHLGQQSHGYRWPYGPVSHSY